MTSNVKYNMSTNARGAIADGDGMIKTDDDDDEIYSIIANASRRTPTAGELNSHDTNLKKEWSKNCDRALQSSHTTAKVKEFLRHLGRKIPKKFRKQSASFLPSMKTVSEYKEIAEDEDDSNTVVSERSCRNDLGTGRSMLVKQRAQVVGRPSGALGRWELSETDPPDSKSCRTLLRGDKSLIFDDVSVGGMSDISEDASHFPSYSSFIRHAPMYIDPTTQCIEEDEEQSEGDSEEQSMSSSYFDEILEGAYDFRKLSPLNDVVESPREYNPLETKVDTSHLSVGVRERRRSFSDSEIDFERRGDVKKVESPINELFPLTPNSNLSNEERFQYVLDRVTLSSQYQAWSASPQNSGFFDKKLERESSQNCFFNGSSRPAAINSWPFPRTRCYSEPLLDQIAISDGLQDPGDEGFIGKAEIENSDAAGIETWSSKSPLRGKHNPSLDVQRRPSLPIFKREEQKDVPQFIARRNTITDSQSERRNIEILWDPRSSNHFDGEASASVQAKSTEDGHEISDCTEAKIRAGSGFVSVPTKEEENDNGTVHPRPSSSSVLATLSASNNCATEALVVKEERMPLHDCPVQNPSPRTLNAATMIAAALRPGPSQSSPALPAQSPSFVPKNDVDEYYWGNMNTDEKVEDRENNKEEELKDLCSWSSSDSFDDVF
eukprot:jgi/Psemu1/64033/estExt_Genemark1.C_480020